jgi:Aspartate/tyrosine/aromatic aminotransferase
MNDISSIISDRLGGKNFGKDTTLYKFAKIKKAKAEAREQNPEVCLIDMGVGEPDLPADKNIVDILQNEAGKAENRWYADNGIVEYQVAASQYLKEVYGVDNINPLEEIIHGIGSKPILAMLPLCFINPGDISLVTVPGYPVISTYTQYLGGRVYNLPLTAENYFYPDLSNIPDVILKRSKLLYINYPNNPTGQVATKEFYKEVVDFAHRNNIVVVSDAAYAGVTFDDFSPLSFLSIDGAKEIGVEIHSMSKSFNMTGWRLAFLAGNKEIIKAFATVKDNTDSGQFRAIQRAGAYALNHAEITKKICERYSRRFDLLLEALNEIGFEAKKPKGSFYCYVKSPIGTKDGVKFTSAEEASDYLIRKALVSTVPWDDAGSYLRFSVTFEAKDYEEEKKVIEEMKERLMVLELKF